MFTLISFLRRSILLCCGLLLSCGSGGSSSSSSAADTDNAIDNGQCSLSTLENEIARILQEANTDVDSFSYVVRRMDGRQYSFNRGGSSLQASYESASTSKLVTAVVILRLVDQGYLSLTDRPQDHIIDWPIPASDSLYPMTLTQLLSFTSGLEKEHPCLYLPSSAFKDCVSTVATTNMDSGVTPGANFYYASTHMHVAGLMAVRARNVVTWQDVFEEFKVQTGLFPTANYDITSSNNPLLAGGMHWAAEEYMEFLAALSQGSLLSAASMEQLLTDHTASVPFTYSPAFDLWAEEWHYGLGLWHECQNSTFNCTVAGRISSPGTYGAYPFWDRDKQYIGLVARRGASNTASKGVELARLVQSKTEEWVACDQ